MAQWLRIHLPILETWRVWSLGREESPGRGNDNSFQYSCLGKSYGQRSLAGYSLWGPKELDMTERISVYSITNALSFWRWFIIKVCSLPLVFLLWWLFACFAFWPHHVAYGILIPWPGIEPVTPALEAQNLNHWTIKEVPLLVITIKFQTEQSLEKIQALQDSQVPP